MKSTVGISHRLKRAWLDDLLDRLVQTRDEKELRAFVDQRLRDELPGKDARAKAAGILLRIWSGVDAKHAALRDRAVAMLPRISGQERIWLHWGMAALAYPFFRDLAEVIGRILTLQDDITNAQVQTRMKTAWGDRETSKEAAGKLITSMVDWEVLRATKTKGHFLLARKMTTTVSELQLWLLEAMLSASASDEIEAQQLLRLPELFPFSFTVSVGDLRRHEGLNIHRQGLDMDMVSIRKLKVEQFQKPTARPKAGEVVQPSFFDDQTCDVGLDNDSRLRKYGSMEPNTIIDPDLNGLIVAENKNFATTTKALGGTLELVQDFQDLYKSLSEFVILPDGGTATEAAKVAMLALHLLMKARSNLLIGSLTLLRGYRGNSLLFLRGAIEACAFASHIRRKPHLADVWLNAGQSADAYKKYKNQFNTLFPKNDALLQELYQRYDRCSKVIHSSLYSMAGHFSYPGNEEEMVLRFSHFDLPGGHNIVSGLYFALDTHKQILKKFAEVLAGEITSNRTVWELRFNSVEAKLDIHRERWKAVIPDPRKAAP